MLTAVSFPDVLYILKLFLYAIYNASKLQDLQHFAEVLPSSPYALYLTFQTTAELSRIYLHFSNLSNVGVTEYALRLMNDRKLS